MRCALANRAGSAIQIVVHDVSGPSVWSKFSYRCNQCNLVTKDVVTEEHKKNKQNVNYNCHTFGNTKNGNYHYQNRGETVRLSALKSCGILFKFTDSLSVNS